MRRTQNRISTRLRMRRTQNRTSRRRPTRLRKIKGRIPVSGTRSGCQRGCRVKRNLLRVLLGLAVRRRVWQRPKTNSFQIGCLLVAYPRPMNDARRPFRHGLKAPFVPTSWQGAKGSKSKWSSLIENLCSINISTYINFVLNDIFQYVSICSFILRGWPWFERMDPMRMFGMNHIVAH